MAFRCLATIIAAAQWAGAVSTANPAVAETNAAGEGATARDARVAWWREARFGMFIHFGLYAIPGRGEWAQWNEQIPGEEYARLAEQFTLANFCAGALGDFDN